jgi:glutamyl-tRNA reductase
MLLCLGLNHRTTPVELRERLAFAESKQPEAAQQIKALPGFEESVVLSTCNRVELYSSASLEDAPRALAALHDYLLNHFDLTPEQKEAVTFYQLSQADAARHLFRVVSGLDSMVLGETEIFGQVKAAYGVALKAGATGGILNKLFQRALAWASRCATKRPSSGVRPPWATWRWNSRRRSLAACANATCSSSARAR